MGTNFYLRHKLSQEEKQKAKQLLDEDKYDELRNLLPKDIHIGKRSYGWKFLWDAHYFNYFKPTKESLFEWLKSGQIINEYGKHFTFDEFINDEVIYEGFDLDAYYNKNPYDSFIYRVDKRDISSCFNCVDVNYCGEFYIDDLRFTINEDFG